MAIIKVMLAGIGGYGDGYLKRLIELSDSARSRSRGCRTLHRVL